MLKIPFIYRMRVTEFYATLIYLPIHAILIPILLSWHAYTNPNMFTTAEYNVAYYVFSFAVILVLCRRFLRHEFDGLMDLKLRNFFVFLQAQGLYFLLTYALAILVQMTGIDATELSSPNNEAIDEMAEVNTAAVMAFGVFLAPLVEEVLFRAVVFGRIRLKNRVLAYVVSIVLFSVLHVWQFAVTGMGIEVLIYALFYVPAAFALAWAYERSMTIWVPIFVHMAINNMAFAVS